MNSGVRRWVIESILALLYYNLLVFFFLPVYLRVYAYMLDNTYRLNIYRYLMATLVVFLSTLLMYQKNDSNEYEHAYAFALRLFYVLSFIPMLALFCCGNRFAAKILFAPLIFDVELLFCLRNYSINTHKKSISIKLPVIAHADLYVLAFCGIISVLAWAMAGFPIVASFSDSYEQRIALRQNSLPTIISYLYTMTGGALLPFLFARNLVCKRYIRMTLSLIFGLFLFFVNGMKTWLLLYILAVVITFLTSKTEKPFSLYLLIELGIIIITIVSAVLASRFGMINMLNQTGRIIIIPNNIGFKYVDFFSTHELLFLRESILRSFFSSPYPGGSDFYINYGVNATITSGRANNGLFGDAFRNFGIIGAVIYPFLTGKVINIIERNCKEEPITLRYFTMLLLVWGAINTSFFTWLLTGGIIILFILLKITSSNRELQYSV